MACEQNNAIGGNLKDEPLNTRKTINCAQSSRAQGHRIQLKMLADSGEIFCGIDTWCMFETRT